MRNVHFNDLADWEYRQEKLPHSYLDFMDDPTITHPDSKGEISREDFMLRQQYKAALDGDFRALVWLLKRIIKQQKAELGASASVARLAITGSPRVAPIAPALEALGCLTEVREEGCIPRVVLSDWFAEAIARHCPESKLAPVNQWLAAGGLQQPTHPEEWD